MSWKTQTLLTSCQFYFDIPREHIVHTMYKFKRPETLPYPNIYYTFTAKDKHSDNILEYRVQDMPEKFFEQAVDFMVKYFLPDETFCASKNVPNKPSAVDSFRAFWLDSLQQKLSIACFRNDGNEELVGANVLIVNTKQDDAGDLSEVSKFPNFVRRGLISFF